MIFIMLKLRTNVSCVITDKLKLVRLKIKTNYCSLQIQQVFRHGYRPHTISFPNHKSRIIKQKLSKFFDSQAGDTQTRTLFRALHFYFNQSVLRILCDVMARISQTNFVQVVLAHFNHVLPLFRVTYVSPIFHYCQLLVFDDSCIVRILNYVQNLKYNRHLAHKSEQRNLLYSSDKWAVSY